MKRFPGFDKRIADLIKFHFGEGRSSRSEFARSIDIRPQAVNMWLSDTDPRYPNAEVLEKIREKYGVTREFLLFGIGEEPAKEAKVVEAPEIPHSADQDRVERLISIIERQSAQVDKQLAIIDKLSIALVEALESRKTETEDVLGKRSEMIRNAIKRPLASPH
jgi:transcriptional regulator with XRE-family HTH domain